MERDSCHWTRTEYFGGGLAVHSRSLIHVLRAEPRQVWWQRWLRFLWKG